jgi:undecaprenyl-diphosphatase
MVNNFDREILEFLSHSSGSHYLVVKTALVIAESSLLKGAVAISILWWVWLKDTGRLINQDMFAIKTIIGACLAVIIGRFAQNLLPMRPRPIHNPEVGYSVVEGIFESSLESWSSFPSDHAVLFFAIATAVWIKSRPAGLFLFFWSLFVICLPRVYLGLHYPTDIVAGAALGIAIMFICVRIPLPAFTRTFLDKAENRHSALLYPMVFLLSLQIATLFDGARHLAQGAIHVLSIVIRDYT